MCTQTNWLLGGVYSGKMLKISLLAAAAILATKSAADAPPGSEQSEIAGYVQEAAAICHQDDGALWGTSLCGPLLLINPGTREVFANQHDSEHQLREEGGVYLGKLPANVNVANTAVAWAGVKWTMIMLPLPEEKHRRAALMAHEMWHRIQEPLGLPQSGAKNDHLDTRAGRFWLQLEWRALAAALSRTGTAEQEAITDAVTFRARRQQIFPEAAAEERSMEMNEGLAEYTGVRLSGSADLRRYVIDVELKDAPAKPTFVRSFAYATGPAYGVLLDESAPGWPTRVRRTDNLTELLAKARGIALPADLVATADKRAEAYAGAALAESEANRERDRAETEKIYRARLVDGPVLVIPLQKMNMQFNPGNLIPLPGHGTVYPQIRIIDAWGVLDVTNNGALLASDFSRVVVAAPAGISAGENVEGDGWKLHLNAGWTLRQREGESNYAIVAAE
ncbi:MAG: hypothetical protein ACJ8KU_07985 [Chthoniobacterales bacterium]